MQLKRLHCVSLCCFHSAGVKSKRIGTAMPKIAIMCHPFSKHTSTLSLDFDLQNVTQLCGNGYAFAAVRRDGRAPSLQIQVVSPWRPRFKVRDGRKTPLSFCHASFKNSGIRWPQFWLPLWNTELCIVLYVGMPWQGCEVESGRFSYCEGIRVQRSATRSWIGDDWGWLEYRHSRPEKVGVSRVLWPCLR